jgi:hypothetical protein
MQTWSDRFQLLWLPGLFFAAGTVFLIMGKTWLRGYTHRRDTEPKSYWLSVAFIFIVGLVFLIGILKKF